ncbi:MAG: phosphate/phosphite/phosphonate ABC transporter substrate-binding protein [Opitutales bacterium]
MNFRQIFCGLLGVFMVASVAAADRVVIALKPDKNPEQMLAEKTALEAFLSESLGRPVSTVIPLSAAVIIEGLTNGSIDAGYLSATDMVHARRRGTAELLLAGRFPDGRTSYDSYWLVRADAPYRSIEDLEGHPVAFASRSSTSGFVVPLQDLHARGLLDATSRPESFFGEGRVVFGVGYVSAVERLLAGDVEAAAVSNYVLDEDKHLTAEQRAQLRRLQAQGPVPSHVIAVRASLPEAEKEALRAALLRLNEAPHEDLRDRLFSTMLVEVDAEAHLADLDVAIERARRSLQR